MKQKQIYVCTECNAQHPKWMGQCSNCGAWSTLEEQSIVQRETKAARSILSGASAEVVQLGKVSLADESRLSSGFAELDLVLGGGLVSDQVVLLAGEPGIGKSTLLLQSLISLTNAGRSVLYVSGEESAGQVASRAARLYRKGEYGQAQFVSAPGVHALLQTIQEQRPELVIVDSIQTIYDETLSSLPGSLAQVKSSTALLVSAAKQRGFILILVGHINKEGAIAGPKVLEHLVDTVLQFEGEREGEYRMVRALKNRFGPTGEVALLVMGEAGLADMTGEYNVFDKIDEGGVGIARTLALEGNRPLVVQVQALVNTTVFPYPKRVAEGISTSRLQLICAIVERFTNVKLGDKDVYVKTLGGYKLSGTAADLAIAAAIVSSATSKEIPSGVAFCGELTLGGRLFASRLVTNKLSLLSKLGVKRVVLPPQATVSKKNPDLTLSSLTQLSILLARL